MSNSPEWKLNEAGLVVFGASFMTGLLHFTAAQAFESIGINPIIMTQLSMGAVVSGEAIMSLFTAIALATRIKKSRFK